MHSEPSKEGNEVPAEVSDESLIERYVKGDTHALEFLVGRYQKPLYNFLWRMTGSEADSDEIFQDTWLRVITKSEGFRQERFKGWLFKIAHNLAIDWSRRKRKLVSLDAPAPGGDETGQSMGDKLESGSPGPDEQTRGREVATAVTKALAELPREQREVFVMRMEAGMAFKDIAKIQAVSLNTALARMQYALAKMRNLLKQYQPDGE